MAQFAGYKALYEIARAVHSSLEVAKVLEDIVESVTKAIAAKGCAVMLLNVKTQELIHSADYGLSSQYVQKGPVRLTRILSEVLKGEHILILDVATDPWVEYREEAVREGIVSMLSVPMSLGQEPIGVLRIYTSEYRMYSTEEIEFLRAVANLGALALDRARTHEAVSKAYELHMKETEERTKLEASMELLLMRLDATRKELIKLEGGRRDLLRLLYVAGHDLKAPLAAVQSYLSVLLAGYAGEIPEKVHSIIQRSSSRVLQMIELISNIMDLSRLEAGQLVSEMKQISLEPVINESLEVVAGEASKKGITIKRAYTEPLPNVLGDKIRLQQVLTNILANAVIYTPSGGLVTLRVTEKSHEVIIEVLDNGIGIPAQDMSRIFEEFFRGSNVDTPGTGLGLAIVKRIVEAHGGKVWAESPCSETGQGSKFTVSLLRQG